MSSVYDGTESISLKHESGNPEETNGNCYPPAASDQPRWGGVDGSVAPHVTSGVRGLSSPVELLDDRDGAKARESDGGRVLADVAEVNEEAQLSGPPQSESDGNGQHPQHDASSVPSMGVEYPLQQNQHELGGSTVVIPPKGACASYPYSGPFYGGMMAAYGTQALVHPQILGMHHPRMPLPLEMVEEPVYVNPKQYHGILRRRQTRAKAELERKLIKVRKPYLHESRHQHAMRRARGCGGRFLNTKKLQIDETKPSAMNGDGSDGQQSTQLPSSVDSEQFPSECAQNMQESNSSMGNGKGNGYCHQHHQDFRVSAFRPLQGERGEEGNCTSRQWGGISVNRTPHRALTIQ